MNNYRDLSYKQLLAFQPPTNWTKEELDEFNKYKSAYIDYEETNHPSHYVLLLNKGNYFYLLASDKVSLTRNVEEAYHLKNDSSYTRYGYENEIKRNWVLPEGYSLYSLLNKYKAQQYLDELHPLPRKNISKKVRKEVYNIFNGHCAYCGCEIPEDNFDVDHITSHMWNKGTDEIDNYYPSCKDCNKFKMCSPIERFRKNIKDTIKTCSNRNKNYLWDRIYRKYGLDVNPDKEIKFLFEDNQKNDNY